MDKPRNVAVYMRVARAPRAWIYCRVAEPDAFALRTQQEELTAFAKDNHYEVVGCTAKQENKILPRLQNIEACYTSTYNRYEKGSEEIEQAI